MMKSTLDEETERPSRFTGVERITMRRTSIVVSTATSSPLHHEKYNVFVRVCEAYPQLTFFSLLSLMTITTIIGCAVTLAYRENFLIDRQGSTLILSSGEGLIAKINSYIIDMPESECHGKISTYPDGRYSSNLFDIVTVDSEDDFFQPRKCKWISEISGIISSGPFSYPTNLVGKCNVNAVTSAYTEGVAIVFEGNNLLTPDSLVAMCKTDNAIRNYRNYKENKCRLSEEQNSCCPSRSIPNYVAALAGLTSCENITDSAVETTEDIMGTCYPYFIDGRLTSDCWDWQQDMMKPTQCPSVPEECAKYNAVYDLLTSLMESDYHPIYNPKLKVGKLLIPYNDTDKGWLLDLYYDKLEDKTLKTYGGAQLVAYNLRIKTEVFEEILSIDSFYLIPISFITFLSILLASNMSIFVAFFGMLGIYLCFGMTWFVYGTVLYIQYAPFFVFFSLAVMIYLGLLLLSVYKKNWDESFDVLGVEISDVDRLAYVWHHTCLKNFVSAMSCSCNLFAIILFPLPSMKCFGLFSGISILFLFLVSTFYFPSLILLNHKLYSPLKSHSSSAESISSSLHFYWRNISNLINQKIDMYSECFAKKYDFLFTWKKSVIVVLLIIGCVLSSYSRLLKLDDVASPQLLFTGHPFEQYDRHYDLLFRSSSMNQDNNFEMVTVFGVQSANTIEPFNPSTKSPAQFISLNISGQAEQQLLYDLCQYMITEKGKIGINISIQNVQCYPLYFNQWMSVSCEDTINHTYPDTSTWKTPERTSCCGYDPQQMTYPEDIFLTCSYHWSKTYGSFDTGLWWSPDNHKIIAVTIGMESRVQFSNDYDKGLDYWDDLDSWTSSFLKETELRKGFSTSNVELLRYQRGLVVGLSVVSPLCISIAALVVLFMSRNLVAALTLFFSTYFILGILGGSLQIFGERFGLFSSMSATLAMAVGCGISSLVSHAYCEAGTGFLNNLEIGQYIRREITPSIFMVTISLWLSSLFLLGGGNYFTFAFGVVFIFIVLYSWIYPHTWNLLLMTTFWLKQPFGQIFVSLGLTPPPCCLVYNVPEPESLSKPPDSQTNYRVQNPLSVLKL